MAVPGLLLTVVWAWLSQVYYSLWFGHGCPRFITHCGLGMAVPGLLLTVVLAWLSQVYY